MPKKEDLTGRDFGRLHVMGESENRKGRAVHWWCQCRCGELTCVAANNLKSGASKSCGCLREEQRKKRCTKHGQKKVGQVTKIYNIWLSMMQRCYNPKCSSYKNYGQRGISVCGRWHSFENFYADMGDKPKGKSLDRRDNNVGYNPENVVWATMHEQAQNRRAKGCYFSKKQNKWMSVITRNGETFYLGRYEQEHEAKEAYRKASDCFKSDPDRFYSKYGKKRKVKGYSWCNQRQKWCAHIKHKGKQKNLGRFETESEARSAYLKAKAEICIAKPPSRQG
jgi:hypothetical protein